MDEKNLEKRCFELFGDKKGVKLFDAMTKLFDMKCCIATGWNERQVSIAASCENIGRIFYFLDNYKGIIMPDGNNFHLDRVRSSDIWLYLPNRIYTDQKHCYVDLPSR